MRERLEYFWDYIVYYKLYVIIGIFLIIACILFIYIPGKNQPNNQSKNTPSIRQPTAKDAINVIDNTHEIQANYDKYCEKKQGVVGFTKSTDFIVITCGNKEVIKVNK